MSKRAILIFLASLVMTTWILQVVALRWAGGLSSPDAATWLVGAMFMPVLWSLAYLVFFNRSAWRDISWKPGNPIYLLIAALIPVAAGLAATGIAVESGVATSGYFTPAASGVTISGGPWLLGQGLQGWPLFLLNVALTGVIYAVFNGVATIGEEFGWRGLLQPQMMEQFGLLRGVSLLGLAWALWHLPVILAGYNYPETPVLGALVLFPLTLIAASFTMAWLTLAAGSFWPAVVLHGSVNGAMDGILGKLEPVSGGSQLSIDLISLGIQAAIALVCIGLLKRRGATAATRPSAPQYRYQPHQE